MSKPPLSFGRKALFSFTTVLLLLVIIVAVGELFVRMNLAELYKKKNLTPPYDTAENDAYFGWKMKPGYAWAGGMLDVNRQTYPIHIRYDQIGRAHV